MSKCEICGKSVSFGNKISETRSHVSRRSGHMQKANVKRVKVEMNGASKTMYICTRCLRSNLVKRNKN